jgi:protein CpxP
MENNMTDTGTSAHDEGPAPEQTGRGRRRWRGAIIGAALFAVGTASGFAVATAHGMPWWMLRAGAHHRLDPEHIAKHVDRRVERVLSRVDATEEQRNKVSAITKAAISDLSALGVAPWEARGKFVELLRADTIDPAAFETLRAEQIGKADAASKRIVQALTEAASVLTPEQRRELTERWEKRMSHEK